MQYNQPSFEANFTKNYPRKPGDEGQNNGYKPAAWIKRL